MRMAYRPSFRRKPETRNVRCSPTPVAIGAIVTKCAPAPMPSGGLRRNDEGELAGRFPYDFTSKSHSTIRNGRVQSRRDCPAKRTLISAVTGTRRYNGNSAY